MTLLSIPDNPVPEGALAGTIGTPDGATLRFARWAAPANGRGTVCVFTGRSEYIEKYFETVQDLRQRGYAVAVIDWRGQGHSSRRLGNPLKGHVENFSEYQIDVAAFVKQVVLPDCPPPYFALAHSMGGAVMLRVAHAGIEVFERFVLCAPMIDLPGLRASLPMRGLMRTAARGRNGRAVHSRRQHRPDQVNGLSRQSPDLGPAPLCPQRGYPGGRSDARDCVADRGVARRGLCRDGRVSFA